MNTPLTLHIPVDHPAFAGHFPGSPIVPGVVLLDLALHAIVQAQGFALDAYELNSVKFLSPLSPDIKASSETCINFTVHYKTISKNTLNFDITADTRKIASANVTFDKAKGLI